MIETPRVGVVIPAYSHQEDLGKCLKSLYANPIKGMHVVVVDNASTDDTVAYISEHFPQVTLIEEKQNRGYVGGVNRGWEYLQKKGVDYLMILTQDVMLASGWAEPLLRELEAHPDVSAAQPLLCYQNNHEQINSAGNMIHFLGFGYAYGDKQNSTDPDLATRLAGPSDVVYASGGAVMLRATHLQEVGLFQDDFFMYHDDLDLGWRIRLAGYRSVLVPQSRAYHRYEFHRSTKIKYRYGEQNRLVVLLENYHWATLVLIFPAWLFMEVGVVVMSLAKGWLPEKLHGYNYVIRYLPKILQTRKKHQALRRRKEKDVVRDFASGIYYQEAPNPFLRIVNPVLGVYWRAVRGVIFW